MITEAARARQGNSRALTGRSAVVTWVHQGHKSGSAALRKVRCEPYPHALRGSSGMSALARDGTVVIGVLGGIASGKSAVARLLAGARGVVLDADELAQEALDSAPVLARLRAAFGRGVLDRGGRADREALAELVFGDPEAKRLLESWIHPLVRERIVAGLAEARAAGRAPVVLDVPLLLENDHEHGLASSCDFLVFVAAGAAERERRAVATRKWRPGEVARREVAQVPPVQKRARARYVIDNDGSLSELESAVRRVLAAEGLD